MGRAATTSDVFHAIAEPRRRAIVELLAAGSERDVTQLVLKLGLPQPAVSKHLGVLRKVGIVAVQKSGQRRLYRLNARQLKPVHDWIQNFERLWTDHLDSIKSVAEQKAKQRAGSERTASDRAASERTGRDRAATSSKPTSQEQRHGR